jgi:hypothetical protein
MYWLRETNTLSSPFRISASQLRRKREVTSMQTQKQHTRRITQHLTDIFLFEHLTTIFCNETLANSLFFVN